MMKSTVVIRPTPPPERPFPKLLISRETDMIVLGCYRREGDSSFAGTVINSGTSSAAKKGSHFNGLLLKDFKDFYGTVTLEND